MRKLKLLVLLALSSTSLFAEISEQDLEKIKTCKLSAAIELRANNSKPEFIFTHMSLRKTACEFGSNLSELDYGTLKEVCDDRTKSVGTQKACEECALIADAYESCY